MGEGSTGMVRRLLAAGALALMAGGLIWAARLPAPEAETTAPAERTEATAPSGEPAAEATAAPEEAASAADAEEPAEVAAVPEADRPAQEPAEPAAPGFDVVRVEPDGSAVVAGRAEPGTSVTVLADDEPLAEVEADAEGNFVAIFRAEPSDEPRALTLLSETAEGETAVSDEAVVLLPEAPPTPGERSEPETAEGPTGEREREAPKVAATAIVTPEGVEVAPAEPAPVEASDRVALASISYAEQGEVTLAGSGPAGTVVRIYVDDDFTREAEIGPDGRWTMELGDVEPGVYTLRVDQLDASGEVASRVETPFQRDLPRPSPRPGETPSSGRPVAITVQPGSNLWTLARTHYGSGVLYTQIFTANRDLIRDPDLIYPGQIFALPEPGAAD